MAAACAAAMRRPEAVSSVFRKSGKNCSASETIFGELTSSAHLFITVCE